MGMAWSNPSKATNRKGQPYDVSLPHCAWLGGYCDYTAARSREASRVSRGSLQNKLCLLQRPLVLLQTLVAFEVSRETSVGGALQR